MLNLPLNYYSTIMNLTLFEEISNCRPSAASKLHVAPTLAIYHSIALWMKKSFFLCVKHHHLVCCCFLHTNFETSAPQIFFVICNWVSIVQSDLFAYLILIRRK